VELVGVVDERSQEAEQHEEHHDSQSDDGKTVPREARNGEPAPGRARDLG